MRSLAKRLIELAPPSINKVFFTTGGSEANEFALRLARQFKKKVDIAYLENGYHGLTLGSLEVTGEREVLRSRAGKPLGKDNYGSRPHTVIAASAAPRTRARSNVSTASRRCSTHAPTPRR